MNRFLFIVNPLSGGKDKQTALKAIEAAFGGGPASYRIVFTAYPGHAKELAAACEEEVVVAVGGDGTVHEVACGLAGSGKVLGIIPCGSGDGLALHLGISRRPRKAVRTLLEGETARMDLGSADGVPFCCTAGVGLDAEVAYRFASSGKRGLWTYIALAWKIWRHYTPDTYTLCVDGETMTLPATMITVGNAAQWGNGAWICPRASVTDGLLDLTAVAPFHWWEIPVLAGKLLTRRAHTSRRVTTLRARQITIQRTREAPFHMDGDPFLKGMRMDLAAQPAALGVIVPRGRKI